MTKTKGKTHLSSTIDKESNSHYFPVIRNSSKNRLKTARNSESRVPLEENAKPFKEASHKPGTSKHFPNCYMLQTLTSKTWNKEGGAHKSEISLLRNYN